MDLEVGWPLMFFSFFGALLNGIKFEWRYRSKKKCPEGPIKTVIFLTFKFVLILRRKWDYKLCTVSKKIFPNLKKGRTKNQITFKFHQHNIRFHGHIWIVDFAIIKTLLYKIQTRYLQDVRIILTGQYFIIFVPPNMLILIRSYSITSERYFFTEIECFFYIDVWCVCKVRYIELNLLLGTVMAYQRINQACCLSTIGFTFHIYFYVCIVIEPFLNYDV